MVNPKIDTLKNHFRLQECKFEKTSNYLASKLTSEDNNIQRLREILAQLQTIAAKLEEISEQMSAFMTLDDLEPFLRKSADFSLILIHYADKIDNLTQSGPSRSSTCAPFERRYEESPSAPTNPASQQQQDFATAPNNTTRLPQFFINSGQPVTRAPSQPQLPTHIMDMTGPELSRHLGSLDNSHVSTTTHQDPSYTGDIQRNTEFDPEQHDLASEAIPSQICEPHLDNSSVNLPSQRQPLQLNNSVVTLPHQQQPLSIACHLPHHSPSTTATSRIVYTTNYHLPTFDTVLTNSVRPSYQVVNSHFPLPHMQSANLQHLPPSSVLPPAEPLSQFCPSSNHQTFLPVTQPIAAHPDICFATNTKWITRTFPNPATECPPMLQPHCINQPIQQSVTSAPIVPVVSTQHPFAASCIKLPPVQIPKFDGDPLAFHDWINIFKASVHENRSISQTH